MSTYTYECNWCNRLHTVTRLNKIEICCGSQMKLVKTYSPRIYDIKTAVTNPVNELAKNEDFVKRL